MSVALVDSLKFPARLVGNGVSTVFVFQFKILSKNDLRVYVAGALKTVDVDYTVAGFNSDAGGTVTFLTGAPVNGAAVVIQRAMQQRRTTDYQQDGDFLASTVNPDNDNPVLLIQDLQEQISRCLRLPVTTPTGTTELSAGAYAGMFQSYDSQGRPVPAVLTSVGPLTEPIITDLLYPQTAAEAAAGVVPTDKTIPSHDVVGYVDVMRYGADRTGVLSSQTAFDNAVLVAKRSVGAIKVPWGIFKINWLLQDANGDYLWIKTDGFFTRLIPVSSASPVVDIYATTSANGVTGLRFESCLIDSQLSGVATHAGIGFRVRASNPGFVWKCKFGHIYVRGFNKGIVRDCDVNLGEIFDNDFDQMEVLDCNDRSLDLKGIYNRNGRIFVTESGNYALVNQSSQETFTQIVTDGPVTCTGASCVIGKVAIEGINGAGASSAFEINNQGHCIQQITLKEIPTAKCPIGVAFGGVATQQIIGDITVTGTNYPATAISLGVGSAGVLGSASIPAGSAKISTSTSIASAWRFLGDVSSAYIGDRYLNANLLVENTGRIKQVAGGRTAKRAGLTYGAAIATDASLAEHFTVTVTNGVAFTMSNPSNAQDGATIEYTIYNSSGGAMGAVNWGGNFKLAAFTNPANGFNRSIRFRNDGSFWTEMSRTPADVPN